MPMTLEEYKQREGDDEFAPGWAAIDECVQHVYGDQEPRHLSCPAHERAIWGGREYLDGCSIFSSNKGYRHIVSYGMTELTYNEDAFQEEYSGWGFEWTMKWMPPNPSEPEELDGWVVGVMADVARWANLGKKLFEPLQCLEYGLGKSINPQIKDCPLTAFLLVNDTEVAGTDSVHGRVDFLQLVAITQADLEVLKSDGSKVPELIEKMKADSPDLVLDFARAKTYLT